MSKQPFQVGETIRLVRGYTPMVVQKCYSDGNLWWVVANYRGKSKGYPKSPRPARDFVSLNIKQKDTKTMTKTASTIYKTPVEHGYVLPKYGTERGVTSEGKVILEFGSGELKAYDRDLLTPLLPWTYTTSSVGGLKHYVGPKDCVQVNQVIIIDGSNYYERVRAVDTRNESDGLEEIKGSLVATTQIPKL